MRKGKRRTELLKLLLCLLACCQIYGLAFIASWITGQSFDHVLLFVLVGVVAAEMVGRRTN